MAMIAQKSQPRTRTLSALCMSWSMERARSSTTAYPLVLPTKNKHGWPLWPTIAGHAWPDKRSSSVAHLAITELLDYRLKGRGVIVSRRSAVEQAVAADLVAAETWRRI